MKYAVFLMIIIGSIGCSGVYNPEGPQNGELTIEDLVLELSSEQRYVSTDEVADKLINQDPSIMLVDVRSRNEYNRFNLPESKNLPLESLLSGDLTDSIDCERFNPIFYSASDEEAERAWLFMRSLGCRNIYVMRGGLNAWMETIIEPNPPGPYADTEDLARYQNRIGASQYFLGSSHALEAEPYPEKVVIRSGEGKTEEPIRKKIELTPRKKRPAASEEGC